MNPLIYGVSILLNEAFNIVNDMSRKVFYTEPFHLDLAMGFAINSGIKISGGYNGFPEKEMILFEIFDLFQEIFVTSYQLCALVIQ